MAFGRDSVGRASRLFAQYGPLVTISHGGGTHVYSPRPDCAGTVLTYGVEAARQIATHDEIYHKAPLSGRLYPLDEATGRKAALATFGTGLFAVNDEQHRLHRRLMSPSFSRQCLRTYADDMVRIADETVAGWREGELLELAPAMEEITRRIATKTLFGEDGGPSERAGGRGADKKADKKRSSPEGTGSRIQTALRLLANPWTKLCPIDVPGLPYHRFLDTTLELEETIREIVRRKRAQPSSDSDVLSMLIRARDEASGVELSERELLGHVGVLFAAGHETSANALNWTLFLLSQHPRIYANVVDELRGVLGGAAPRDEQLTRLPLLEAVIHESMRVLPPVPWNARVTSQDTSLLGCDLPAGTEVFLSIYQTHHCPELFERPLEFDPARWDSPDPGPFAYMPFSVGPRKCLGAAFAMMELKIVLAIILQRFRLEFVPRRPVDRVGNIVMAPKYGLAMRLGGPAAPFGRGVGDVRGNVHEMVALPSA